MKVIPFASENYESDSDIVFWQDNFGPPRSKSIKDLFDARSVTLIKWTA